MVDRRVDGARVATEIGRAALEPETGEWGWNDGEGGVSDLASVPPPVVAAPLTDESPRSSSALPSIEVAMVASEAIEDPELLRPLVALLAWLLRGDDGTRLAPDVERAPTCCTWLGELDVVESSELSDADRLRSSGLARSVGVAVGGASTMAVGCISDCARAHSSHVARVARPT